MTGISENADSSLRTARLRGGSKNGSLTTVALAFFLVIDRDFNIELGTLRHAFLFQGGQSDVFLQSR